MFAFRDGAVNGLYRLAKVLLQIAKAFDCDRFRIGRVVEHLDRHVIIVANLMERIGNRCVANFMVSPYSKSVAFPCVFASLLASVDSADAYTVLSLWEYFFTLLTHNEREVRLPDSFDLRNPCSTTNCWYRHNKGSESFFRPLHILAFCERQPAMPAK